MYHFQAASSISAVICIRTGIKTQADQKGFVYPFQQSFIQMADPLSEPLFIHGAQLFGKMTESLAMSQQAQGSST